jgi:hypothetical protein
MTIRRGLRLVAISRGVGRRFLQAETGEERTTGSILAGCTQFLCIREPSCVNSFSGAGSCSLPRTRLTEARLLAAFVCTKPFKRLVIHDWASHWLDI